MLSLAVPAAASAILNNAFRVIDQYAVQWLGTPAQAAIGSSTFVLIAVYGVFVVVAAGAGPLVARATGAGDAHLRRRVLGNATVAAIGLGAVATWVGWALSDDISRWIGLTGAADREATAYLCQLALWSVPMALAPLVDAAFIAMGRVAFPMALQVVATLLNGLLNWLFIYRLGMGIEGAAVATGLSRTLTVVVGLAVLGHSVGLTEPT